MTNFGLRSSPLLLTTTVAILLVLPGVALAQDDRPPPREAQFDGPMRAGEHRDPRGHRGPRDRQMGPELSDEELEQVLDVLTRVNPQMAERLREYRQNNPAEARVMIRRHWYRIGHLMRLREHDPESFELHIQDIRLDRESHQVARSLREATSKDDKDSIEKHRRELRSILNDHFDLRQKIRQRELERLEQRIKDLREQLGERARSKAELIEQRFNEMTGATAAPQW